MSDTVKIVSAKTTRRFFLATMRRCTPGDSTGGKTRSAARGDLAASSTVVMPSAWPAGNRVRISRMPRPRRPWPSPARGRQRSKALAATDSRRRATGAANAGGRPPRLNRRQQNICSTSAGSIASAYCCAARSSADGQSPSACTSAGWHAGEVLGERFRGRQRKAPIVRVLTTGMDKTITRATSGLRAASHHLLKENRCTFGQSFSDDGAPRVLVWPRRRLESGNFSGHASRHPPHGGEPLVIPVEETSRRTGDRLRQPPPTNPTPRTRTRRFQGHDSKRRCTATAHRGAMLVRIRAILRPGTETAEQRT